MRRTAHRLLALAMAALALLTTAPPASAATRMNLTCAVTASLAVAPGLSSVPHANSFAGTGTVGCVRTNAPQGVLTGTLSLSGTSVPFDTCVEGAGSGTFSMRLKPAGVPAFTLTGRFTYVRDALALRGPVTMTGDDSGFGSFAAAFAPAPGQTCLTTPVTRATVAGTANLNGRFA
ncbi:MAG: hypothetical protein WD770_02345 [Actinomycetota bacterium]